LGIIAANPKGAELFPHFEGVCRIRRCPAFLRSVTSGSTPTAFPSGGFMKIALALTTLAAAALSTIAQGAPKPPQYVVLAFDGSKSLDMWNATRDFAKSETAAGRPLKFTYFINAVYYLADQNKAQYHGPHVSAGRSAIGFGGTAKDVLARFDQTNLARQEGNEIANHAAGHFDGSKWSEADWKNEFDQFYDLLFNMFGLNRAEPTKKFPRGWTFSQRDIIGFRAPQLGKSAGLFQALPQFGIRYDTSYTGKATAWPKKRDGLWYFPLASIPVAGTGRKTLAMDYNFYYMQSGAKSNPRMSGDYEEQMYQSYINYFQGNYRGNRAPINIGHHFSLWNGGAYWRAMQRFAQAVCGQPDVKCVTYEELLGELDKLSPNQLASFEQDTAPDAATQFASAVKEMGMGLDLSATFSSFSLPPEPASFDEEQLLVMDPPEAHDE
jgi:hypothetical protein